MGAVRLPRFSRAQNVRSVRLTNRDLEIIRHVNRHRFLRSTHICRLVGGSSRQILRRLQLLYHHAYLERPRAQLDYFYRAGSEPIVYGLGNKAVEIFRPEEAESGQANWNWKNQSAGRVFLEHALLTADVMVAFELACRTRGDVRLVRGDQISLPENARKRRLRFQWRVVLANRYKLGVVPDQTFLMQFVRDQPEESASYFFLEADRGTMPVFREDLGKSSFYRKLLAYHATWRLGLHRTKLGFPRFRVLTVTNSAERMKNMLAACGKLDGGQGLFLFADANALLASDPLDFPWISGRGESVRLLPQAER